MGNMVIREIVGIDIEKYSKFAIDLIDSVSYYSEEAKRYEKEESGVLEIGDNLGRKLLSFSVSMGRYLLS